MRIIIALLSCTCFLKASSACALQAYDARRDFNLSLYPHLTDTNQSQIFEPVSSPYPYIKLAKVHFLVDASDALGFDYSEPQFDLKNAAKCNELGFSTEASACLTAGQNPAQLCPYDTSYTNACCDPAFKFRKAECSYPRTISSNSCNNKYRCYCDTTLYPYTASNCAAPYVLADKCIDDSGSHYAECTCPSGYKTCGTNQVGLDLNGNDGGACTEGGVKKYPGCRCTNGYSLSCSEYGPKNSNDFCLIGTKFYKECKTVNDVCTEELKNKYSSGTVVQGNCGVYETELASCTKDSSFKICQPTCKSQIATSESYKIDRNGFVYSLSSPNTAYVIEDTNVTPIINSDTGSSYTSIYSAAQLAAAAPLCGSITKPVITVRTAQDPYVLSRYFNGVDLHLDNNSYNINSYAYFDNVTFSGSSDVTIKANGSNARFTIDEKMSNSRNWSLYFTSGANGFSNNNATISTLDVKSGSSFNIGSGVQTINTLRLSDGNSKIITGSPSKMRINDATVTNYAFFYIEPTSTNDIVIDNLTITYLGRVKTNYVSPLNIGNLRLNQGGILKYNYSGGVRVTNNIYLTGVGRMCGYCGTSSSYCPTFNYRDQASANCWAGTTQVNNVTYGSCAVYYSYNDHNPMSVSNFNHDKCSNDYHGDRWLTKNAGLRGREMCGQTYNDDAIEWSENGF